MTKGGYDDERVDKLMKEIRDIERILCSWNPSVDDKSCFKRIREIDKELERLNSECINEK